MGVVQRIADLKSNLLKPTPDIFKEKQKTLVKRSLYTHIGDNDIKHLVCTVHYLHQT